MASVRFAPLYAVPSVRAAVLTLVDFRGGPLWYRLLAEEAIARGYWVTEGVTPWHAMNEDIREDQLRSAALGIPSVFERSERGYISLAAPRAGAVVAPSIDRDAAVRAELLTAVRAMSPFDFEALWAELLRRMGFRQVERTPYSGDGGVDIRARYVCGAISEQKFAYQVKRWKGGVDGGVVARLRGVLAEDEQGVVVAPSRMLPSAVDVAKLRRPIDLVDQDALIDLLVRYELGVERRPLETLVRTGFETFDSTSNA